jgi:predicted transposase/invertase (TIGR01784 family)
MNATITHRIFALTTMPSRYLDPKIDLAFKRVFGEHKALLKSFLNALLPLPEDAPIESLTYLTPEQVPELPGLFKNSIVDVKCVDTQGRTFIVEMQMLWSASFAQRIVFAASQAYVKQLHKGQSYSALQPVYALAITNQIFDHQTDAYYHHYQIVNVQNPQQVLKGLEFVFIELPKFQPGPHLQGSTAKRLQVKWLRFLNEVGWNDQALTAEFAGDADIQTALGLLEMTGLTQEELEIYHIHMDKLRIEPTVLQDAEAKGKAEGKAEGITQMVKALHASGMNAEKISQLTQLSLTEVRVFLALK